MISGCLWAQVDMEKDSIFCSNVSWSLGKNARLVVGNTNSITGKMGQAGQGGQGLGRGKDGDNMGQ